METAQILLETGLLTASFWCESYLPSVVLHLLYSMQTAPPEAFPQSIKTVLRPKEWEKESEKEEERKKKRKQSSA